MLVCTATVVLTHASSLEGLRGSCWLSRAVQVDQLDLPVAVGDTPHP